MEGPYVFLAMTIDLAKPKSVETIRWGLIVILTFFISHYLSYQKLPFFDNDYSFPIQTFVIVLIYGILICQTNTFIYRKLNKTLPFEKNIPRRMLVQFLFVWVGTGFVFLLLQVVINKLIFSQELTFYSFSFYLIIVLMIATFETTAYTVLSLYNLFKHRRELSTDKRITVRTNGHLTKFDPSEVAYVHSKGGIVTLVNCEMKRYITQFSGLQEIEPLLPPAHFFRVNRQFSINKKIVREVKDSVNRKLIIQLDPQFANGFGEIAISRYKRSEFKRWFSS